MNTFSKALTIAFFAAPVVVCAQEERRLTLVDRVPFSGDVEQIVLVAMSDANQPKVTQATWIAPQEGEEFPCIGRVSMPNSAERLQVLSVVLGAQGEVRSAYRDFAQEELPPTSNLTLAELRSRFVERRGVFRKLQNEAQAQEERLYALQRDADNIAMVSKIVSAEDGLSEIKAKVQRVALAQEGIERRSAQAKSRKQPLNAQKREAELVQQLGELSTALTAVENQAIRRLAGAKGALQEKLSLIEETREDHIAILEEELANLRKGK